MYKYDNYDQQMVDTRVEEFRDQTRRRLSGELSEEKFRPLRRLAPDLPLKANGMALAGG